jgi:hypothetical protein
MCYPPGGKRLNLLTLFASAAKRGDNVGACVVYAWLNTLTPKCVEYRRRLAVCVGCVRRVRGCVTALKIC